MKACKHKRSKGLLPKPKRQLSMSPKLGGPPTKFPLKVMHPNRHLLGSECINLKAPSLSCHARAHTYIKYNRGGL